MCLERLAIIAGLFLYYFWNQVPFCHNEESKDSSKSGGYRVAPYVIDLGLEKN